MTIDPRLTTKPGDRWHYDVVRDELVVTRADGSTERFDASTGARLTPQDESQVNGHG